MQKTLRGDVSHLKRFADALHAARPELPLEELVFLLFLCELTMVLVLGARRVLDRAEGRR